MGITVSTPPKDGPRRMAFFLRPGARDRNSSLSENFKARHLPISSAFLGEQFGPSSIPRSSAVRRWVVAFDMKEHTFTVEHEEKGVSKEMRFSVNPNKKATDS